MYAIKNYKNHAASCVEPPSSARLRLLLDEASPIEYNEGLPQFPRLAAGFVIAVWY